MRRAVCFDLGHHLLLQRQIFKHRLDHDIHLFKAGVIGRAGDQHHLFCRSAGRMRLLRTRLPSTSQLYFSA